MVYAGLKRNHSGNGVSNMMVSRMQSAANLLNPATLADDLRSRQEHENDEATTVIVCEPERSTIMMGGLHPRASLFEKTVHLDRAVAQHTAFREALEAHGLKVRSNSKGT